MIRRIAFLLPHFRPGGAERVVLNWLGALDRAHFAPVLMLGRVDGDFLAQLPGDVPVVALGGTRALTRPWRVARALAEHRIDLAYSATSAMNLALLAAPTRVPRIVSEHTPPAAFTREAKWPAARALATRLLRPRAAAVAVPTAAIAAEVGDTRVHVVRNPVLHAVPDALPHKPPHPSPPEPTPAAASSPNTPPARPRASPLTTPASHATSSETPPPTPPQPSGNAARVPPPASLPGSPAGASLVAAGRLVPAKGFDILIDAAALLARDGYVFTLAILGDGPLRPMLAARIAAAGLGDRITLPGHGADLAPHLAAADLLVSSSRREGFGNVLVEAMAAGTPVLATRAGGPETFIDHGVNGFLAPAGDAPPLAAAIAALLADPRRRLSVRAAALETARRYTVAASTAEFAALADAVIARARHA